MPRRLEPLLRSLGTVGAALRNRAIARAALAFLAFNAVEMGVWTTTLVYAYGATGPASVGIVATAQLLPSAFLAPLLSHLGDRFPRRLVLLAWFGIQAVTIAATGAAIVAGAHPFLVYAIAVAATITLTQTRPILSSLLPELADGPDELTAANVLSTAAVGLGVLIGPMGSAAVLAVADPGVTLLANAAALAVGAILLLGLRSRGAVAGPAGEAAGEAEDETGEGLHLGVLLRGLREVARDPDLLVVIALLTGELAIFGGLEVLVVLLAIDLLGIGDAGAGVLMGAVGVGSVLGSGASFVLVGRRRLAPWLGVAAILIGLPVAAVGALPVVGPAIVLLAASGLGFALIEVVGFTLLQRIVPDAVRSRVFGVLEGLQLVGESAGSVVVPPLAAALGPAGASIALGLVLPITAGLAVARFATIDRRVRVPVEEITALRGVRIFAPLGPAALEALARHLERVPMAAGQTIFRQGDGGDRWYLIAGGEVDILVDGERRRTMGTGSDFGEIALLRDVPRTATVIATVDGSLWTLTREEFLAGVTGSPVVLREAERTAAARLSGAVEAAAS